MLRPPITGIMAGASITGTVIGAKAPRFNRAEPGRTCVPAQFLPLKEFAEGTAKFRAVLKENAVVPWIVVVRRKKIVQVGDHFGILGANDRQLVRLRFRR